MNNSFSRWLAQFTGMDLSGRFGEGWDTRSALGVWLRLTVWLMRGSLHRIFFKSSKGILMIGKRVTIRQPHHLSVGKSFIAQDNSEINCLSKRGVILGDKVTVGSYAIIRPTNLYGGEPGEGLKMGNNSSIGPYA